MYVHFSVHTNVLKHWFYTQNKFPGLIIKSRLQEISVKTCQKKQTNKQKEQNSKGSGNTFTFADLLLNVMCYENVFSGRSDGVLTV